MSGSKTADPLDPENDLFWEGPEGIRKQQTTLARVEPAPEPETAYRLAPDTAGPAPAAAPEEKVVTNTTLKRMAGPIAPKGAKAAKRAEPELIEADAAKLREIAELFGREKGESIAEIRQVHRATEGFRKMYCGALTQHTTEKDLTRYFGQFGEIRFCQVIRDRDTGMSRGYGFVTMEQPVQCHKALSQRVHVVDNRTIRVSLTHTVKDRYWEPPAQQTGHKFAQREQERIELMAAVNLTEVREGRLYVGPLPPNVSPNILADHFSTYGTVANSNISKRQHNTMKKNFGVVQFKETMAVKRALQNPRHFINEQFVHLACSKFAMEAFLNSNVVWVWGLPWSVSKEDLYKFFGRFGKIFKAMHIFNPLTGDRKGYGFVDFVDHQSFLKSGAGSGRPEEFEIKGQAGWYGKELERKQRWDMMFMEDRFGGRLLKEMYEKVPDSGDWGGGEDHMKTIKTGGAKTVTCKLPKRMLGVVVGEDGKIITEIARDSNTKISLLKAAPQEETCLFHIVGTPENCKTAQYMMQIKIKEKLANPNQVRYNR